MNDELSELYHELENLQNRMEEIGDPKNAAQVQQLADLQADINIVQEKITCAQED